VTGEAIYFGEVMHRRLGTVRHRFSYRIFSILVDLDRVAALGQRLKLFSYNRANLFSFQDRDHGARDGSPLRPWVERHLAAAGLGHAVGGRIRLLCFPRLWGYVFNPLSVFFCEAPDGTLAAILYEVNNTFGERHSYLLPVNGTGRLVRQGTGKRFHVSPFLPMELDYAFRILPPGVALSVAITVSDRSGPVLVAVHEARRRPLSDRTLATAFLTHPLLTLKVVGAILWEALKLWSKRVPVFDHPAPPAIPVTVPPVTVPPVTVPTHSPEPRWN
jgi:DUF1365 family protein